MSGNLLKMLGGIAIAFALLAAHIGTARAEEYTCQGFMGAVIVDNLRVPPEATCTLDKTTVEGTIKVERGARLQANGVRVIGNIQAENAAHVRVDSASTVGGSIQIKQGGGALIRGVRINGDLQFESNRLALSAAENYIGGNLQAFQNNGGVAITSNVIDGNLQCKENQPRPTGGNNTVHGSKEDQCANLGTPAPVNMPYRVFLMGITR